MMKDGHRRLSFPNLETWDLSDLPSLEEGGVDWPQRMATHCRYMADMVSSPPYGHSLSNASSDARPGDL